MGDQARIQIYESMGLFGADKVTEEQEAYTRLFCTEAYYYLDSIFGGVADETGAPSHALSYVPSYAPSLAPSTDNPTSESPTSMAPSSAAPTSLVPTATIAESATGEPTIDVPSTYEPTMMESSVITTNDPTAAEVAIYTNEPTPVATTYEPTVIESMIITTTEPTSISTVEPTPTMTTLSHHIEGNWYGTTRGTTGDSNSYGS